MIVFTTNDGSIRIKSPIEILHGTRPRPEYGPDAFSVGVCKEDTLKLRPVIYCKQPPKVNAFHRLIPRFFYSEEEDHYDVPLYLIGDAKEKKEDQVGLVKFSDWRYEQEMRAFLPVEGKHLPDARVLEVASENICGLIFGPLMSMRDRERAILCCHLMRESAVNLLSTSVPPFMFFQAIKSLDNFDFKIVPIGVLGGLYYERSLPIKDISDLEEIEKRLLREASTQIGKGLQDITT